MGLKTRIALLLLILGAPLFIYIVLNAVRDARTEHEQAAQRAQGLARLVSGRLDDHVREIDRVLRMLGHIPELHSDDRSANDRMFQTLQADFPVAFEQLVIWDVSGKVLWRADPGVGKNIDSSVLFERALHQPDGTIAAPVHLVGQNSEVLQIVRRIRDEQGRVTGIIGATLPRMAIEHMLLPDPNMPADALISMVDQDGVILARSLDPEKWIGTTVPDLDTIRRDIAKHEGSHDQAGIDGVMRVFGYSTTTNVPWLALVGLPADSIARNVFTHVSTTLGMEFGLLLAITVSAALIGRSISNPLGRLANDAGRFGAGDLDYRSVVDGPPEFEQLANAMNSMAISLQRQRLELARSEQWLKAITDTVPALIAYIDQDQRFRFANRFYLDCLGSDPNQMLGRTLREVLGDEAYAVAGAHAAGALEGMPARFELALTSASGSRDFVTTFLPDYGEDGEVLGFFALHQDVTDQKKAVRALSRSEARLRAITDNIPIRITYIRTDGTIEFANLATLRASQCTLQEVIGRPSIEIFGKEIYDKSLPYLQRAMAGATTRFERESSHGSEIVVHDVTYTPDRDDQGDVRGIYGLSYDITALKRAQDNLSRSERHLRAITDNLPAMVAYIDSHERYRFVNAPVAQMLHIPAENIIGRTVRQVRGKRVYQTVAPHLRAALAGHTARVEGHDIVAGRTYFYQSEFIPDVAADGRISGAYAMTYDISDRKNAEQALRTSEERLRLMIEGVTDYAILSLDAQGHVTSWNAGAERIQGYRTGEILGQHFARFYPADAVQRGLPAMLLERATLSGRIEDEGWRLRKDETLFWGNVVLTALRDDHGILRGFGEVTRDLTERKRSEEALKASETKLRAITDHMPVLICYIDRSHTFRFNNRVYEKWLRRPLEEITHRPLRDVFGVELYGRVAPYLEKALSGDTVTFELELLGWDGTERFAKGTYIPDHDPSGLVIGVHGLIRDITAAKRSEMELTRAAHVDSLTGLSNRRQFNAAVADMLKHPDAFPGATALMFLDLDHFKKINDLYGHQTGDEVLKEFASRLKQSVRESDLVGRLAGDEFVVLLAHLRSAEEAQFVARKILSAMRLPFEVAGHILNVSTSIGIAIRRSDDETSLSLLSRADEALYAAKRSNRDTYRILA